ncbi:AAA family ATPase [Novosphingobium profundi]|uniref:AAA family ATPase n=1 Tax=Novosphingobium profundi TaxID=1774954 RepID=UPI001BD9262E|nr:AAA family ATPase [Novosphingobium profundi]
MLSNQILKAMIDACENAKTVLRKAAIDPSDQKTLDITFWPSMAAEWLGRSPRWLAKLESKGKLPSPKITSNGRRYYTLEDLTHIREAGDIKMGKLPEERAVVVAVQNFKGGVSKSTTGKHLADYLALRGYRVLVVDCDPQASMSVMFDANIEGLVDETHTLSNFLSPRFDEANSFKKTIKRTAWPNIDICPANLGLQDTEWEMTATIEEGPDAIAEAFRMLRMGLEEVRLDYDVIILDPPPAMGFLGVNTLTAADGLLIPVPARQLDYLSTIHFMQTCREAMELVSRFDTSIDYGFIKVVCTMFQPNRTNEAQMLQVMEKTYAGQMLSTPILLSEEIKNAGIQMSSIYEINKPYGSHQTYIRCRDNLNMVFREVEEDICKQWPSRASRIGTSKLTEAA